MKHHQPAQQRIAAAQHAARIDRLFENIRRLGIDRRDDNRQLMEWVKADPSDTLVITLLEERVAEEENVLAVSPDAFRSVAVWDPEALRGRFKLGRIVQTGFDFGLTETAMLEHLLVVAGTGRGKTTLLKTVISEVKHKWPDARVIIIERKRQFTDVAAQHGFSIIDTSSLRINPLVPPTGMSPRDARLLFTQSLIDDHEILVPTANLISEAVAALWQEYRADLSGRRQPPNLKDLHRYLLNMNVSPVSRRGAYREAALNRIGGLLDALPEVWNCRRGYDPSEMLRHDHLILIHHIPNLAAQNYLLTYLVDLLFVYRMMVDGLQDGLRTVIVLDEISLLFRRIEETRREPSYLTYLVTQARGYGIGLLTSSHMMGDLSHLLLANTGTKILVGGPETADDGRLFLGLRPHTVEQTNSIMGCSQKGRAFIADPRHEYFIECQVDRHDFPPEMSQDEIARRAKETAARFNWDSTGSAEPSQRQSPPDKPQAPEPAPQPEQPATPQDPDMRVLADIERTPFEPMSGRQNRLAIKRAVLDRIVKRLEAQHLIVIHMVNHRAGAPRHLYEITEDGYRRLNKDKPRTAGKGGFLHQFYQRHISAFLKGNGYSVTIEGRADDKLVDIIAVKQPEGETVAVEIELHVETSDHFIKNMEMDLAAPRVSRVLCLVPTKEDVLAVQSKILDAPSLKTDAGRIHVDLLRNHMRLQE